MLKLVLLAVLAIGCKCVEEFTVQSTEEFERIRPDVLFPSFRVYPEYFSSKLACSVYPVPNNGLEFQANLNLEHHLDGSIYKPHFSSPRGDLILRSVQFQFPDDGDYRVIIRVQRTNEQREWIVESKVCLPPTTEDAEAHADSTKPWNAVRAKSLTPEFVQSLKEQETNASGFKDISFDNEWVLNLLNKNKPRRTREGTNLIGVPVIVPKEELTALNDVRLNMLSSTTQIYNDHIHLDEGSP